MAECSWGEREARAGGWDVQTGREEQEQKPRAAEAEGDTQAWPLAATNWKLTVERSRTHGPMRGTSSARPQACRNLNYVSLKHTRCSGPLRSVGLAPWPHLGLGPPSFSTTPLQTFRWHWGDYQQLRMSVLSRMLTSEHRSKTYKLKGIFLKCQWVQPISVGCYFPVEGTEATKTPSLIENLPHHLCHLPSSTLRPCSPDFLSPLYISRGPNYSWSCEFNLSCTSNVTGLFDPSAEHCVIHVSVGLLLRTASASVMPATSGLQPFTTQVLFSRAPS